jgi:hypothetical protein
MVPGLSPLCRKRGLEGSIGRELAKGSEKVFE